MLNVESAGERRFSIKGELDAATAPQLLGAIEGAYDGPGDLQFEVSGLSFCDSTGLRALLQVAKSLDGRGALVLQNPSPGVKRLLDLTGIEGRANLRSE